METQVDPLDEAQRRLSTVKAEIENHRSKIRDLEREAFQLEQFIATYYVLMGIKQEPLPAAIGSYGIHSKAKESARGKNPPRVEVGDAAEEYIRTAGHPVNRSELYRAVSQRLVIHGNDPEMVFSTMMWRMRDRFIRLRKYGYWLRNVPCPEAGYVPEQAIDADFDPQGIFE